jgi:hypothetical protein
MTMIGYFTVGLAAAVVVARSALLLVRPAAAQA